MSWIDDEYKQREEAADGQRQARERDEELRRQRAGIANQAWETIVSALQSVINEFNVHPRSANRRAELHRVQNEMIEIKRVGEVANMLTIKRNDGHPTFQFEMRPRPNDPPRIGVIIPETEATFTTQGADIGGAGLVEADELARRLLKRGLFA